MLGIPKDKLKAGKLEYIIVKTNDNFFEWFRKRIATLSSRTTRPFSAKDLPEPRPDLLADQVTDD